MHSGRCGAGQWGCVASNGAVCAAGRTGGAGDGLWDAACCIWGAGNAPRSSVLLASEGFKLQILTEKIVSSIQNRAGILLKCHRAALQQLGSLARENLAQELLPGLFVL